MSKSRIVYIAVLVIALLMLLWDKTGTDDSLSNPQASVAAAPAVRAASVPPPAPATGGSRPMVPPAPKPLPASGGVLNSLFGSKTVLTAPEPAAESTRYRDLFSAASAKADHATLVGAEDAERALRQAMMSKMTLTGTLVLRGSSTAQINGKSYAEGDYIGPYYIKEIAEHYVMLASDDFRARLYIEP